MVYDGVIGLKFSDFKEDGVGYIDIARKAISIESEEVLGFTKKGMVFVIFNILTEAPMVITEKFDVSQEDEAAIREAIKKFNKTSKEYISTIEEADGGYQTIVTVSRDIYDTVTEEL